MEAHADRRAVVSADGTAITYESLGAGAPVLIVPGVMADAAVWMDVARVIADSAHALVVNRRGRGGSGDTEPWSIERELDDIAAVAATLDAPPIVLGHSSGGVLAVLYAQSGRPLSGLALYQPAILPAHAQPDPAVSNAVRERVAHGDLEGALECFIQGATGGAGPEDERGQRLRRTWGQALSRVRTIPYDIEIQAAFRLDADALAGVQAPALMMIGAASPPDLQAGSRSVAEALGHCSVVELPGQGHEAHLTGPSLIADAVLDFCRATAVA